MNTVIIAFLRLTALVLLYFIVISGLETYAAITNGYNQILLPMLLPIFLTLAALIAWFFPQQLCDQLLRGIKTDSTAVINAKQLLHVSIILLGLGIFIFALIDLAYWMLYFSFLNSEPNTYNGRMLVVGLFNISFRLVISLVLLTKSYWITLFLLNINAPEKADSQ